MRLTFAVLSLFGLLLSGCSDDARSDPARFGTSASEIIAGTRDTSRGAVVAILGDDPSRALCTGTLIASAPAASTGWVLTAAHCVASARSVRSGPDFAAAGAISLPIGDRFTHPSFAPSSPGSSIDVGVLRVTALAPGVTPIPILAPEVESLKVTVGAGVVYVGYGMRRPGTATSGNGPNTERISLAKTIAQVGGDRFESTYVSGGPCHGDEGGPALVTFGGRDALVATSWFMTQDCMGRAVSLRAHAFAPWVASLITTERTRLGAYGSADGVVASTTVGGIEDASAAVTLSDAATSSGDAGATGGPSAVGADGQRASVLMGAAEPGDVDASARYPGADVSLPGTSACSVSGPAFTDTVAIWTALALVLGLARRRLSR